MSTAATGGVRFGGSGYGPEYIGPQKRRVDKHKDEKGSTDSQQDFTRHRPEDAEVFLFTVKDPVRSALAQLMTLIKVTLLENPGFNNSPEVISGPLGYTSIRAVRPVSFMPTKTIFRPVTR